MYPPEILKMEDSGTENQRQEKILSDDSNSRGNIWFQREAEPVVAWSD
jgi:hypothetical protein